MTSRSRILPIVVLATIALLLVSGCGGGGALPGQAGLPAIGADAAKAPVGAAAGLNVLGLTQRSIHIVMITHGQASDPFWTVVQNGAQAAARQLGVSVSYEAPDSYDVARMSQLIEAAIATKPSGLVVSLPNPVALAPAVHAAERAGIPVISINSGADAFSKLGTLLHVGEDEYQAGYAVGQRMRAYHVHRTLCVIHEAGNLDLDQRCRGLAAALAAAGVHTSVLDVNLQNASAGEQRIAAALREGRFDGLLTFGGYVIATPALKALQTDHLLGRLTYATFGIGPRVLIAIRRREIGFAADTQPFLQGYLPVVLLTEHHLYGILPDRGELISIGPVFVTQQNAAHVLALVNQGVR